MMGQAGSTLAADIPVHYCRHAAIGIHLGEAPNRAVEAEDSPRHLRINAHTTQPHTSASIHNATSGAASVIRRCCTPWPGSSVPI
jgi:hypothetical protein